MMNYEDIIYNSNLPALKLDLDFPVQKMHQEILDLPKSYFVGQIGNENWKGTVLRGIDASKPRPCHEYGYRSEDEVPYKFTEVADLCPVTIDFINSLFSGVRLYRIKLSNLLPGGKIHPHTDSLTKGLGVSDKTTSGKTKFMMFAISWPWGVVFNMDKYSLPIRSGEAWLLNYSFVHEVANLSTKDRYMLTVTGDLDCSERWRELVKKSYCKNSGLVFPLKDI